MFAMLFVVVIMMGAIYGIVWTKVASSRTYKF